MHAAPCIVVQPPGGPAGVHARAAPRPGCLAPARSGRPERILLAVGMVFPLLVGRAWEKGDIVPQVRRLKEQDGPELQVHGSSNLLQTLIKHGLVDRCNLRIFPAPPRPREAPLRRRRHPRRPPPGQQQDLHHGRHHGHLRACRRHQHRIVHAGAAGPMSRRSAAAPYPLPPSAQRRHRSPSSNTTPERCCAVSGIRLVHSRPASWQGRGKHEQLGRSIRIASRAYARKCCARATSSLRRA